MGAEEELAALLASPAMEAPDGVTPDFDNPPNANGLAWFVTTFCMVITTSSLCLRLYARTWKTKQVRIEEGTNSIFIFVFIFSWKKECVLTVPCSAGSLDLACLREPPPPLHSHLLSQVLTD